MKPMRSTDTSDFIRKVLRCRVDREHHEARYGKEHIPVLYCHDTVLCVLVKTKTLTSISKCPFPQWENFRNRLFSPLLIFSSCGKDSSKEHEKLPNCSSGTTLSRRVFSPDLRNPALFGEVYILICHFLWGEKQANTGCVLLWGY